VFFLAMPWYTRKEKTTTPPTRVTGRFISIPQLLLAIALVVGLTWLPLAAVAAESSVELEPFTVNLEDKGGLQQGASTFVNSCMGCHGARFSRYGRVASDLGIPPELMEEYLVLNPEASIGDLMESALPQEEAKNWFGVAPPDLTLVARVRSPEWLYGYLKGFYEDPSRPFGVNNTVFKNVGMPNVLESLQGKQICTDASCAHVSQVEGTGTLSEEEFDEVVTNLVNFLTYLGEPARLHRETIGGYVLFFLAFLFVFVFMLNREYWKDIH